MLVIEVKVLEGSTKLGKVKIDGRDEVTVGQSQTVRFESDKPITISAGEAADTTIRDDQGNPVTDVAPGQHGNPNGISQAVIGPKMAGSGDTEIVTENGRMVERTPRDVAVTRQGGGPDSEDGRTPGEQPSPTTAPQPPRAAASPKR